MPSDSAAAAVRSETTRPTLTGEPTDTLLLEGAKPTVIDRASLQNESSPMAIANHALPVARVYTLGARRWEISTPSRGSIWKKRKKATSASAESTCQTA